MNRTICGVAFAVGLIAVLWVGAGYVGSSALALTMTALIGFVYVTGAVELLHFHRSTSALARALDVIPDGLENAGEWLRGLPGSLQNPVRLRIEGERVGLPGPAMTPYLVGLLVLLGMLGTFLGMVVTLKGAVIALESTTNLEAIRASLAAPVRGLGVAFGTSVAGVAASAMLGLISAVCRRERLQAGQLLDTRIATTLRGFLLAHQRQETYKALQLQAQVLPELVAKFDAMMAQMDRQGRELNEQLVSGQERFHRDAREMYSDLARSVDKSLRASLTESTRLAGETIQPVVASTMDGIARETAALQERVAQAVGTQLDGIAQRFDASVAAVADTWTTALTQHERTSDRLAGDLHTSLEAFADTFAQRSTALVATIAESARALQAELAAGDEARRVAQTRALESMAVSLQREWHEVGAQTLARQEHICETLGETARDIATSVEAQAGNTIAEVSRLMLTAAEAPRAAAEVIGQLRHELSASSARDNELLAERSRIMETLNTLLDAINRASTEQREAIDALVASSSGMLERAGNRFVENIDAESARMVEVASEITGGAVEVASLSEAFGLAVQLFTESNDRLMTTLQRIEGALDKSLARSDEQLAYYVAQAREIIDLSIMSQRQIVDDLQALSGRQALVAGEV
ncbi:DUF802 domain-containing protein [Azoarcus sp. DN11]|uniref:DUF802 domain-containing protein n=1 Tax=Azoarcus sp. DN11 TaxID=356837 RepID=UPI000EAFE4D8|nr:DUF802 domain-containing protein [Azoarcus sp. DN11]AYH44297.1 hypothetical protein CDA09_13020 [Azoarcus sp. DN11]